MEEQKARKVACNCGLSACRLENAAQEKVRPEVLLCIYVVIKKSEQAPSI